MPAYFVDLDAFVLELPEVPQPTFLDRFQETAGVAVRRFPRVIGLRKPRAPDRATAN
jgi:hypothetical protein